MQFKSEEVVSLAYHKGIYTKYSPTVIRALGGELKSTHAVDGQSPIEVWEFEDGSEMTVGDEFANGVRTR